MRRIVISAAACLMLSAPAVWAIPVFTIFEAAGATAADISASRDAFRVAIGGGAAAGPNGSFGGVRREINWDGTPAPQSDPNPLSGNFFNVNSPRGVVFSTPGTGFLVSANAGFATPPLFGFPNDFQTFSPQKLFTAVNSNITDVNFFVPGTTNPTTTTAFALIFVDVEVADATRIEFFDQSNTLVFSRNALVGGNQGLTFLGAVETGGSISRVRITSGLNTLVSNGVLGNPNDDIVVMDDFLFAEPAAVPEPSSLALLALGLLGVRLWFARKADLPQAQSIVGFQSTGRRAGAWDPRESAHYRRNPGRRSPPSSFAESRAADLIVESNAAGSDSSSSELVQPHVTIVHR